MAFMLWPFTECTCALRPPSLTKTSLGFSAPHPVVPREMGKAAQAAWAPPLTIQLFQTAGREEVGWHLCKVCPVPFMLVWLLSLLGTGESWKELGTAG